MFEYFAESGICLAVFYVFYRIFLFEDTFFTVKRFYLLAAILLALVIPLLSFTVNTAFLPFHPAELLASAADTVQDLRLLKMNHPGAAAVSSSELSGSNISGWFWRIYLTTGSLLLLKFLYNLGRLFRLIRQSDIKKSRRIRLAIHSKIESPFSFMHYVFMNGDCEHQPGVPAVLAHERVHVYQLHTLDVIFLELLTAFFWFNPFIYLYKKSIGEIHEYLADQGAVKALQDRHFYRKALVEETFGFFRYGLVSSYRSSLIKKRLKMLSIKSSHPFSICKTLLVLPAIIVLVFFFSSTAETGSRQTDLDSLSESASMAGFTVFDDDSTGSTITLDSYPEIIGSGDMVKKVFRKFDLYPEEARKAGKTGVVVVEFTVGIDGQAADFKVKQEQPEGFGFAESSIEALKMVKFKPGTADGKPVPVVMSNKIKFELD